MRMFGTVNSFAKASTLLLSILILSSCGSDADGDCFYDTIDTKAKVIDVKSHADGEGRIAVILSFEASKLGLSDQEMGDLKNVSIDHDFLARNNIEIGNRYDVTVSEITKGSCTPSFVSFHHSLE